MQAEFAIFDGPEEALSSAVTALGGKKTVARMLWPLRPADAGGAKLRDALDPSRAEKLEYDEIIAILRAARDAGHYAPFQWFAAECGFDARPITKADEIDRIATIVANSTKELAVAVATLERLQRARAVA